MNTLESFIDLDSMTNAQSLDWSEVAATLEQSKAMYPTSEKLFQRVSNIGDFLRMNWAVMSTQSKIPIYRKLRYIIEEAIPATLEALLEQLVRQSFSVICPKQAQLIRSFSGCSPRHFRFSNSSEFTNSSKQTKMGIHGRSRFRATYSLKRSTKSLNNLRKVSDSKAGAKKSSEVECLSNGMISILLPSCKQSRH